MTERSAHLGTAAAIVALATLAFAAHPADAAPAPVTGIAAASSGSRRAITWTDGNRLYLQRLNTDGTPKGPPVTVADHLSEGFVGTDLSITITPTATIITIPAAYDEGGGFSHMGPLVFEVAPGGTDGGTGGWGCELDGAPGGSYSGGPLGAGASAWNGQRFLLASACTTGGLVVASWIPGVDGTLTVDTIAGDVHSGDVTPTSAGFTVAYQHLGPTDDLDVAVQRYSSTGNPTGTTQALAGGEGDQSQPTVAASGSRALAAWVEGGNLVGRTVGATTLGPRRVLVNATGNQNHPTVAASSSGAWHLAWADLRSGGNDVYVRRVPSAIPVAPANGTLVAGGVGAQRAPSVAALPDGRGYVAYLDGALGKTRDLTGSSAPK